MSKSELGEFLQARRAAVSPTVAGLPDTGQRRRVPGLRREEVAAMVGLSTDYYVRLEQGRGGRPSESVLDAIAAALMLDTTEREHLYRLAHPPRQRPRARRERVSPPVLAFLHTLTVPALVMTSSAQVIGWNGLASAVFTDFANRPARERNTAWLLFRDEEVAARHRQWETAARNTVGMLRTAAGKVPDDPDLTALVGELSVFSSTFRRLWSTHHVYEKSTGVTQLRHPQVGDLDLTFVGWTTPTSPNQTVVTYTAEPGSPSADALNLLSSITATNETSAVHTSDQRTGNVGSPPAR
ncbi:helix-turn-helix transcriptional regulator [Mycobacterium sp. 4858]|uniref:helix-turn-helix transcriptional regulator n=1 Tax=Mycobacterium sp. 4858 TaxID=2057185 RepID=UPI000C8613E0|nr:helix-turn-helix transcriptional regulator [Mycobacterium sp. 4858]